MKRLAHAGALALAIATGALLGASSGMQELQFPHEKHAALTSGGCETCHAGIYSGDAASNISAQPSLCAGCHDGQMMPEVAWQGYTWEDSGLKFRHSEHPQLGCETCHGVPEVEGAKQPARAETCLPCHGNGATEHLAIGQNPCEHCHLDPKPGHTPDFATQHGTAAAAELPQCSSCHVESFCVDCHDGPVNPQSDYHPANFVMRHGAESWASVMECAECHSTEVFCRDCHSNQGVAPDGRTAGGYHDGVANWLQQHGVAARQDLEGCVSCHQQTECLACHSAKSGWRINPHGPDFDATRAEDRSTQSCGICHSGY
jgi:predicted CXXCH cytochrome family protein